MHTYTSPNSIFDVPIATLLSILCLLMEILHLLMSRGQKSLNGFTFGTFICHFPCDSAASMAVEGLNQFKSYGPVSVTAFFIISLACRYISILPAIHLSVKVDAETAVKLRHPSEKQGYVRPPVVLPTQTGDVPLTSVEDKQVTSFQYSFTI